MDHNAGTRLTESAFPSAPGPLTPSSLNLKGYECCCCSYQREASFCKCLIPVPPFVQHPRSSYPPLGSGLKGESVAAPYSPLKAPKTHSTNGSSAICKEGSWGYCYKKGESSHFCFFSIPTFHTSLIHSKQLHTPHKPLVLASYHVNQSLYQPPFY